MKIKFPVCFAALALGVLILDVKTALAGASDGISLCARSVIPALFPFLVITGYVIGNLPEVPLLRWLGTLCRIPAGAEGILLTGLLGGYPVGARAVVQAWQAGGLSGECARRMLGFCSNAGPAFLFGMLSQVFPNTGILWLLWGIHILSSLMTSLLLPGDPPRYRQANPKKRTTLSESMTQAVGTMGQICGWVILFRMILCFLEAWAGWLLPKPVFILLTGLTELTNGCMALSGLETLGQRFLYAAVFLAFGGLCVGMQTVSVTGSMGTGYYFPGKILQACISLTLAYGCQYLIFPGEQIAYAPMLLLPAVGIPFLWVLVPFFRKKAVAI